MVVRILVVVQVDAVMVERGAVFVGDGGVLIEHGDFPK
jgi:hypothetical protein